MIKGIFLLGLISLLPAAIIDTAFISDFESSNPWSPRTGMTLAVQDEAGHGKVLSVSGTQTTGWNYAGSSNFTVTAGRLYRIEALMKVDSLAPKSYPPYFKWEYSGISGRVSTSKYDPVAGGWQKLSVEFQCPTGVTGGWLAIEKGTDAPVSAVLKVDDILVAEIDTFSPHPYHFTTIPAGLDSLKNTHPRLYFTAASLNRLKSALTHPKYASLLSGLRTIADRSVASGPPAYVVGTDQEQLYQRNVGNAIPHLAMMYVLTGESKYLTSARDWMLTSAGYPTWGLNAIDGTDLATGHQLYGLALGYDWLYSALDAAARDSIRSCLLRRGGHMFDLLLNDAVWWSTSYLQNHQWVDMAGLSAAGLTLYGGSSDVDGWILLPLVKYKKAASSLAPDGAGHEGIPYWEYGLEYLLKFMELARPLLGEDLYALSPFFSRTAFFRLYGMLPPDAWGNPVQSRLMTFADGPRYDWYGPDYMLRRLASEYDDRQAQWLANAIDSAGYTSAGADFLNLLWVDTTVSPQPPSALPLYRLFDDMGLAYLRSSWQAGASVSAFKCGPFIGNHAVQVFSYDPGGGHVHPDAGSFQIFSHNDWLIVDDGYTWKTTSYQNTALVNGRGQIGEGGAWYNGAAFCMRPSQPQILFLQSTPLYDYAMADVKPAYPDSLRLTEFYRHFLYVRPDLWIVADEFSADTASSFELYFHSDYPFAVDSTGHFRANGARARLFVDRLDGAASSDSVFLQPLIGTGGSVTDTLPALRMKRTGQASAFFMNAFQAVSAGAARSVLPVYTSGSQPLLRIPLADTALSFRVDRARTDRRAPLFVDLNAPPAVEARPRLSTGILGLEAFALTGGICFSVRVPMSQAIRIEVFDVKGRKALDIRGNARCGINRFEQRVELSNGIYFTRLQCAAGSIKRTFVMIK